MILLHLQFNHKLSFVIIHLKLILLQRTMTLFFVTSASKAEIDAIISSLKSKKSAGTNSIHFKIFKLTRNEISHHLADIFNLSFETDIFSDSMKTAKL